VAVVLAQGNTATGRDGQERHSAATANNDRHARLLEALDASIPTIPERLNIAAASFLGRRRMKRGREGIARTTHFSEK